MIRLKDSDITQIVPESLKNSHVKAIGYALGNQVRKLLEYAETTTVTANIDGIRNEKLLDLLAIEMKAPYYNEKFNIETKKKVVKGAMMMQSKAGTLYAVESTIKSVLGDGKVIPWYEYDGEPGYFKVESETQGAGVDVQKELLTMIDDVKRKSARLEKVEIVTDGDMELKIYVKKDEISIEFSNPIRIGGV